MSSVSEHLRKELKQWESAFYIVHQRKPVKDDIAKAPKDIKDKYQLYFREKKKVNCKIDAKFLLEQNLDESQTASDVWGIEFNKTPKVANDEEAKVGKNSTPGASLNKLGAKLFHNFTRTQSPLPGRSSGELKKPVNLVGPVTDNICDVPNQTATRLRASEKINQQNVSNSSRSKTTNIVLTSGETEKKMPDFHDDFVVKGELFKSAEKMLTSRSDESRPNRYQLSKPRLSFLSVSMSTHFQDGNCSDDETSEKQILENSEYKATKGNKLATWSDVSFDSEGKKTSPDITCLSKNVSDIEGEEKGKSSNANYATVSQNLISEQWQENQRESDEHFEKVVDTSFGESLQKAAYPTATPDKSPQMNQAHNKMMGFPKVRGKKNYPEKICSGERSGTLNTTSSALISSRNCARSNAESDFLLEHRNIAQNIPEFVPGTDTSSINSKVIAKTGKRNCGAAKSEKSKSAPRTKKNSDTGIKETVIKNVSEADVVLEKKTGQGKRKRTVDTSEEFSRHTNDDNVSEELYQDFNQAEESAVTKGSKVQGKTHKKSAASMSENYVCLNMKRKGYRRKGGGMTGPQLRRKQWKAKMAARSKSFGSNKCFKCGQEGHWASKCPGKSGDSHPLVMDDVHVEESEFPSLREAALMSRGIKGNNDKTINNHADISDIEATIVRESWDTAAPPPAMPSFADNLKATSTDLNEEVKRGLSVFGFSSFRPGQEESIRRILQGLSTLVVLSTGGGKSLCYQLPAYLYAKHLGALTLVVSPLVSLMDDQITGLPPGVNGACLHSGMTISQREMVISSLKEGKVHFLLVSPEAVVERGGATKGSFPPPGNIPPIAFACIDEAHCLSEWSHNFRPSYLRLCKVLRKRYNVRCFLGLTATATKRAAGDVARHLGIDDPESATIRGAAVPTNLLLSASRDENKDEALVNLLKGERFKSCESILIYCSRREHTERVATLIRTSMQTAVDLHDSYQPVAKKRRVSKVTPFDPLIWTAESYHAGLTAAKRRSVQKAFMTGRLRVVVATVAFGMGLDKANVRAVIHYNMAKSFESYVQEIGRAGRDGQLSHCHVFLDSQNKDLCELRRHTYGNGVDRVNLKRFLSRVFKPCRCREIYKKTHDTIPNKDGMFLSRAVLGFTQPTYIETTEFWEVKTFAAAGDLHSSSLDGCSSAEVTSNIVCGGHERTLSIQDTVQLMDMREEGISTLLSYLELHQQNWVENLNHVYAQCIVRCYKGPRQLMEVAKKCPPVAVAIARQKLDGTNFSHANQLDFNVIDVCDSMGWDSGTVKRELYSLQWESGPNTAHKTGVTVELSDLAFHFRSRGDLTANQMDEVLDFLYHRVQHQEKAELTQLQLLSDTLRSVSHKNYWMCSDEVDADRSDKLKEMLRKYFDNEDSDLDQGMLSSCIPEVDSSTLTQLSGDIRHFVSIYGQDHTLTGRAIARIFHGVASPNFPAQTWGRVRRFWRAYINVDFSLIIRRATQIIVSMK